MDPLKEVRAETHSAAAAPRESGGARRSPRQLARAVESALVSAGEPLLRVQHPRGYWCGELEGDTILESEYVLLLAWLGEAASPAPERACRYLLKTQREDGGWACFPGGPPDVSVSVKAYFALKLAGHDPQAEPLARARRVILELGGADRVNSFTRFFLALLGQISFDHCPAVPPELVLLPRWFPLNIYRLSAWTRTIVVPLSIVWASRPARPVAAEHGIRELFHEPPERWPPLRAPGLAPPRGWLSWQQFFRLVDQGWKLLERLQLRPLRGWALRAAERWMTDRFVASDGLGAIFPPIIWSILALKCRDYSDQSPEVRYCHEQLELLALDEADTRRLQPCQSPVWDTALTLRALRTTAENRPARTQAVAWLLDKQIHRAGDWAQTVDAVPGGWCFEHHNEFYPDVDDTAMVLLALRDEFDPGEFGARSFGSESWIAAGLAGDLAAARERVTLLEDVLAACQRGRRWMLQLQNRDGGWGSFDKDNDLQCLCQIPLADHNAMIDPSTPDLTGRVLEALGRWGIRLGDRAVDRAVEYLRRTQEPDGAWFGRWGVNYIYGTWQALAGLAAVGVPPHDPALARGAAWLLGCQQPSGGWGETPASYDDPRLRGQGPVTASQTAWALWGLIAAGRHDHPAVHRGIEFLLEQQREDGSWYEPEFTGTGFPRVFYLRYHLYPVYFPVLALRQWLEARAAHARA